MTGGAFQIAGQDLQKCGLTGTVGADDAVAVARHKLQVHLLEENAAAELDGKIADSDHRKNYLA